MIRGLIDPLKELINCKDERLELFNVKLVSKIVNEAKGQVVRDFLKQWGQESSGDVNPIDQEKLEKLLLLRVPGCTGMQASSVARKIPLEMEGAKEKLADLLEDASWIRYKSPADGKTTKQRQSDMDGIAESLRVMNFS